MQADESKVKALESIFGGQDITASVIRTVLSSNENKFDEAVDSLLNMSSSNEIVRETENEEETEDEEALLDKNEREKIKTLENMFGGDLSNSVICTVLESNKGELVDTVDTLLNMTSKDINPYYDAAPKREAERARQEEDLKSYEEFKRLQLSLQEEEARAIKEQQKRIEEDLRRSTEAAAAEEKKRKDMLLEQERILREFEATKQREVEAAREQEARKAELRAVEAAQEKLRKAWEEKMRLLAAEEEAKRAEDAKRRAEEEARKQQLLDMEEDLCRKAAEQAEQIARIRQQEELKLAERRAEMEAEIRQQEELARVRHEEAKRQALRKDQARLEEEKRALHKLEEEQRLHRVRMEEERAHEARRLEAERFELQRARAELEAMRLAQEQKLQMEQEEKLRKARIEEEERLLQERLEQERADAALKLAREEEERRMRIEIEGLRRAEEEQRKVEEERVRLEEERLRIELDRQRQEQEEARRIEEEKRNQALREEAEQQEAAIEEERRKKLVYDQLAASAVFIPPKATASDDQIHVSAFVSADNVTCDWNLPEGTASQTNWIGLYPVRALFNTNRYVQFVYTNGAHSGQHVFRTVTPGQYEVRFFATRGYEHAARSEQVRVGPAATLFSQLQGDTLLVYYTLDPISANPTREWLGIYQKGTRRNKEFITTAYGNAEGKVMMKAPRSPGTYEVRLFAAGSVYNEQCRCEFVVEDNDCVTVEPSSLMAGANVTISWVVRTVEPSSGDWVGLYRADEANNSNYLVSSYTQGASVGSVTVQAPKEVGVYEVRLFSRAKGKYTTFRTSSPLTIV